MTDDIKELLREHRRKVLTTDELVISLIGLSERTKFSHSDEKELRVIIHDHYTHALTTEIATSKIKKL